MQNTRRRDTPEELALRRELTRLGLRYRVNVRLPVGRRTADVVFPARKLAVFVDGCFWHCCPEHRTFPKANADWWAAKLEANRLRDRDTDRALRAIGWQVARVWEHEEPAGAAARIARFVRRPLGRGR